MTEASLRRSGRSRVSAVTSLNEAAMQAELMEGERLMVRRSRTAKGDEEEEGEDGEDGEKDGEGDEEEVVEEEADEAETRATRRPRSKATGSSGRGGGRSRARASSPSTPSSLSLSTPSQGRRGGRGGPSTPSTARSTSSRRAAEEAPSAEEESFTDLWRQVARTATSSVKSIARSFLDGYEEAKGPQRLRLQTEVVNFLIEAAGGVGGLTVTEMRALQEEGDVAELREKCEDSAMIVQGEAPIRRVKKFEGRLREFVHRLYGEVGLERLLEDRFFNAVLPSVVAVFSASAVRAFRLTMAVAYQGLMQGLVDQALEVEKAKETADAQLDATQRRKTKATAALTAQLSDAVADSLAALEAVQGLLKRLFTSVFCHRYRDVDAELRSQYLSALSSWMVSYPSFFLHDSYLKYLGWTLYDKAAVVRRSSLGGLLRLYRQATAEMVDRLDTFTRRFVTRVEEMSEDVDGSVSGMAIDLISILLRLGVLKEKEAQHLPTLLWDEDPQVRRAAQHFVVADVFADRKEAEQREREGGGGGAALQGHIEDVRQLLLLFEQFCPLVLARRSGQGAVAEKRGGAGGGRGASGHVHEVPHLRHLLVYQGRLSELRDDEYQQAMTLLVDGLLPHVPALQNWAALKSLLLSQSQGEGGRQSKTAVAKRKKKAAEEEATSTSTVPLSPPQRLYLLHLLVAAAKAVKAAAEEKGGGGGGEKEKEKKEKAKAAQEKREEAALSLSLFLIDELPGLLSAFLDSSAEVAVLLQLLPLVDVSLYSAHRRHSAFTALLAVMKKLISSSVDWPALRECGVGWKRLVRDNESYQEEAVHAVEELSLEWREALRQEWEAATGGASQDDVKAATEAIEDEEKTLTLLALCKRVLALTRAVHLPDLLYSSPALHPILHQLLPAATASAHGGSVGQQELLLCLLHLLYVDVVWSFAGLDRQSPARASIERLVVKRNDLVAVLHRLLEHSDSLAVQDAAFEMASDIFVLFSVRLQGGTLNDLVLNRERCQPLSAAFAEHFQQMMDDEDVERRMDERRRRNEAGGSRSSGEGDEGVEELKADLRVQAVTAAGKVLCFDHPRPTAVGSGSAPSFASRHPTLAPKLLSNFVHSDGEVVLLVRHAQVLLRDFAFAGLLTAQRTTLVDLFEHHAEADALKGLAHKFALFHGVQHPSLLPLLRLSLLYAVQDPPSRLPFLDVVLPFVARCSREDAETLHSTWQPLKRQAMEAKGEGRGGRKEEAEQWTAVERMDEALAKKRGLTKAGAKRRVEPLPRGEEGRDTEEGGEEAEAEEPSLLLTPSVKRTARASAGSERSGRSVGSLISLGLSPVREVDEDEADRGGRKKRSRAQREDRKEREENEEEAEANGAGEEEEGEGEEGEAAEIEDGGGRKKRLRGRGTTAATTRGRSRRAK